MKLLRTFRFDSSDERVYAAAASPEEWAVSGAFAFAHFGPAEIKGKTRQAFANGFLGLSSFGRCTFATVGEASPAHVSDIEQRLAGHLVTEHGAPSLDAALPAAREEIAFIGELCRDAPINTVFTVRRTWAEDGGIKEEFCTIKPPAEPQHAKIWTVVDDDA
jgi:hypothetical protein